jgi:dipeptidyl aminopeptidase/acylaminoacyl peptidase
MKPLFCLTILSFAVAKAIAAEEITPYKYNDKERIRGLGSYTIPEKSRFTVERAKEKSPDIVCYMSKPNKSSFPIAILCGGSSSKNDILSIIHFHRYYLQEFLDLGIAVLTIEQRGVDGDKTDCKEFMTHYTRSARLDDHQTVIENLKLNPPQGWNGKFIFLGVSEGGPLVTTLTTQYSDITTATINWCGAGNWSWRDELWTFLEAMKKEIPWHVKLRMRLAEWMPLAINFSLPKTRNEYDQIMDKTLADPDCSREFMGMTYKYHADALSYPTYEYDKIRTPLLVVAGSADTIIRSSDEFVGKAKEAHAPITYMRIPDMNHYVRKYPEVVAESFKWLSQQLG